MIELPDFKKAQDTLKVTPALSVGICIFSVLFYAVYPTGSPALVLYPWSPLKFNLNAMSFYIFPHANLVHLAFNLIALFPLISRFEKANGTVNTGITLNLLAMATALPYCVVGLLLFPVSGVAGLSGICFSFLTYYCHKERESTPVLYRFTVSQREIVIHTKYFPFINLIIIAVLVPSTSFFGHLAGIGAGYLLALGYLKFLYPPSKVVLFIEGKLAPGINHLKKIVDFISEEDAVAERGVSYTPLFSTDLESAVPTVQANESFERRVDS
ncbi:hypothetical protein JCM33374_g6513 [Metschnikowia sp. JCM 33374]|nr:hypothetical protein JCM33374_g6513 [Metschnikowia sp. JCM 33374]